MGAYVQEERRLDRRIAGLADQCYGVVDVDQLRALGATRRQIGDRIDSDFEAAFLDLCDRHEIPRPHMNTMLHGYLVDAIWPGRKLVVELDGWRFHGTRAAFERDKERDAELHAHGLTTLRFTYRQVTTRARWLATKLA